MTFINALGLLLLLVIIVGGALLLRRMSHDLDDAESELKVVSVKDLDSLDSGELGTFDGEEPSNDSRGLDTSDGEDTSSDS